VILGIDTAARQGGVALRLGDAVHAEALGEPGGHAETLIPAVERVLEAAGVDWPGIAGLAVNVGPGSFTGIRVGVATALGIAEARGIPVTGVGCLDIQARACYDATAPPVGAYMVSAADVRRGEAAILLYRVGAAGPEGMGGDRLVAVGNPGFAPQPGAWIVGDAAPLLWPEREDLHRLVPDGRMRAAAAARLGGERIAAGLGEPPVPRYARPADARPPRARMKGRQ
jgi:tRNA threonylcarbamoyladenosine biosynthesis protein TsaB